MCWIMTYTCKLLFLLCTKLFADATVFLQQNSPASVCPGVVLTCTVNVSMNQSEVLTLQWVNADNDQDRVLYDAKTDYKAQVSIVGAFITEVMEITNDTIVSTATIKKINFENATSPGIKCRDTFNNEIAYYFVSVADAPVAPVDVSSSAVSVNSVLLSWSPPPTSDTNCPPTTYTFTITAATLPLHPVVMNTTNATTKNTVSGLIQGVKYSLTVVGVDAAGRVGENSVPYVFVLDTPQPVIGLNHFVDKGTITIFWMPPPPSSRPPVTGYMIAHNTTGNVLVNQTRYTTFVVEGVSPGVYLFTVVAVSILGNGEEKNSTINIPVDADTTVLYIVTGSVLSIIVTNLLIALLCLMVKPKCGHITANRKCNMETSSCHQESLKEDSSTVEERNGYHLYEEILSDSSTVEERNGYHLCHEVFNEYSYAEQERKEQQPSLEASNQYPYIPQERTVQHPRIEVYYKNCIPEGEATEHYLNVESQYSAVAERQDNEQLQACDCTNEEKTAQHPIQCPCLEYSLACDKPNTTYSQLQQPVTSIPTHSKQSQKQSNTSPSSATSFALEHYSKLQY